MSARNSRNSKQKKKIKIKLFGGRREKPCCFCGRILSMNEATLEHVIPLSAGGGWDVDNIRISCESCNRDRGTEEFTSYKKKYKNAKITNYSST
jgi:5-methylcytosine-specific restriction endonuclease McrA